jgi:hypothetical protein
LASRLRAYPDIFRHAQLSNAHGFVWMGKENDMNDSPMDTGDAPREWSLTEKDWKDAAAEWRAATDAALAALDDVSWPAPDLKKLDAWLSAVERQTIAKTRLAALCELQWQKS